MEPPQEPLLAVIIIANIIIESFRFSVDCSYERFEQLFILILFDGINTCWQLRYQNHHAFMQYGNATGKARLLYFVMPIRYGYDIRSFRVPILNLNCV